MITKEKSQPFGQACKKSLSDLAYNRAVAVESKKLVAHQLENLLGGRRRQREEARRSSKIAQPTDKEIAIIQAAIKKHDKALQMMAESDASGCGSASELMLKYLHDLVAAVQQCEDQGYSVESRKELSSLADRARKLWSMTVSAEHFGRRDDNPENPW